MIKALLLDMDGTITDTERIHRDGWIAAGMPPEMHRLLCGLSKNKWKEFLISQGIKDPDHMIKVRNRIVEERQSGQVPLKEGAREILKWLKESRYKTALVTATSRPMTEHILEADQLNEYFDLVLTGDEVKAGKPSPSCYLQAAELLGVRPEECMVVEDSRKGVLAGHSAGCVTVLIPDLYPPDETMKNHADYVCKKLHELERILNNIHSKE